MFKIGELNRIYLGVQGENGARTIEIDVSEWLNTYPNGTVTIWSRRNGDNMNYTPTGIVFDSVHKVIKWTPTAVDTFYAGHGMCGVELNEGTVVKKSKDLDTFVTASAADVPTADGNQYDYNRSINKPQINGNTLVGDMDFRDLDLFDDENMTSREKAVSAGKAAEELEKKADKEGTEITSKIPKTDIVNNLTTTVEGKVLDARQGKALNDGKLDKADVIADYAQTTAGKALDATKGRELYLNKIDKPSGVGAGKFLQTDQDGNAYWGGSASPQEIAEDIDTWLEENVPSGTTIVIDRSLQVPNAAAPADLVGDLKSAFEQSEKEIVIYNREQTASFIQGARSSQDLYFITSNSARCTTDRIWWFEPGDLISFSTPASGTKMLVFGKCNDGSEYTSYWQTSAFSYIVVKSGYYCIYAAKENGTDSIVPSEVTSTVTIIDNTSRITKAEKNIDEMSEAYNSEIDMLQNNIGAYNYFKAINVDLVDVTGTGTYRCGCDCGILPEGKYILKYKKKPETSEALYLTTVTGGVYTSVEVNGGQYIFSIVSGTKVIIRNNGSSLSNWNYYDVELLSFDDLNIVDRARKTENILSELGYVNLFDDSKLSVLQVNDQGAKRVGYDMGVLQAGTYRIDFEWKGGQPIQNEKLWITKIIDNAYYNEQVPQTSPFLFMLNTNTHIILRDNKESISDWGFSKVDVYNVEDHRVSSEENENIKGSIRYSLFNKENLMDLDVTGTGTIRIGQNLGVLPSGEYIIYYTLNSGDTDTMYLTKIKNGTYEHIRVTGSPFSFSTDGETTIYIRSGIPVGTFEADEMSIINVSEKAIPKSGVDILLNSGGSQSNDYDVCIVGGGAGGIGCAYALRNSGLKVCLIDKNYSLGGTHTQAWVNVHAETVAPPFLKEVIQPLFENDKAKYVNTSYQDISQTGIEWEDTLLRQKYRRDGQEGICIFFDPKAMDEKYCKDLKPYIDIYSRTSIIAVNVNSGVITGVLLSNGAKIKADVFVDCTGNDDLLRLANGTVFFGEDSNTEFQSEYGFTEAHAPSTPNRFIVNQIDLIYRIIDGTETIILPDPTEPQYVQPYTSASQEKIYINSCNGFGGLTGYSVVNNGYDQTMNTMIERLPTYWASVKKNGIASQGTIFPGYTSELLAEKKLYDHAPMLGIRETYRAKCERLLNENDLYIKISSQSVLQNNVLDCVIACGNHLADMHGGGNINWSEISENIKPYGVKYGSLVPKGFTNLLIASRGAGFTHIGTSSFRLNKDIMQIGWAAGKACELFIKDALSDFRNVSAEKLVDNDYTGIVKTVEELEEIMN